MEPPDLTWSETRDHPLTAQGSQSHGLLGSLPELPHGSKAWLFSFSK